MSPLEIGGFAGRMLAYEFSWHSLVFVLQEVDYSSILETFPWCTMVAGSTTDYTMPHSSYLYFVDRRGMLRALMPFGRPATEIAHDVRLLLRN